MSIKMMMVALTGLSFNAGEPTSPSFCARLAPQLGMRPISATIVDDLMTNDGWRVNLLKGLAPALFGGTVMASFSVRPIREPMSAEYERLEKACDSTVKGAVCRIEGPARISVGTKSGKVSEDIREGEWATVEMRNTSITCRDDRTGVPPPS